MRIFVFLLVLLLCQACIPLPGFGQCLALDEMLAIGAEPTALTVPQVVTGRLTAAWAFTAPTGAAREAFWTLPAASGETVPIARLQLRAQRPGQDVVLKTTDAACVRQLRGELKGRKLASQPVTCPGCEAVRFQGADFEATIYSQMKGDYPFVVVLHQVPTVRATAAPVSAAPSVVRPIDIALAVKLLTDPQITVIDVRTSEEFATGHLQGAKNINFRGLDFSQLIGQLDPKRRYVLYCATGNRSGLAVALMQQQGITNVVNAGGYNDLKAAGAK